MSKKIVLLNTWHNSYDDRVFYHQAKSLAEHGYTIQIISTKEACYKELDNITINSFNDSNLDRIEKVNKITAYLKAFSPDIIICDSPLAVLSTNTYRATHRVKIIYDVTEWYPSKIHLQRFKGYQKLVRYFVLLMANLSAGLAADSFIFGEYYKSLEYRSIYFWKRVCKLPYYPDLEYIENYPLREITSEMNLLYTGKINQDKGIDAVMGAIKTAGIRSPEIKFKLKIIGNFQNKENRYRFNNLQSGLPANVQVTVIKTLPFSEYCKAIGNTDLFLDLRIIDFENTHCLPIKLFYYLACGRPVLYSNLKAIRREIKNIDFGYLCDPTDVESIAGHIKEYIDNPNLYAEHAANALAISKSTYNWKAVEQNFISFIESHFRK
ncbi:MAG: glycosyltransferase [Paludibacter sp.]|nr:glycosyltransferase [Paludibacter sp.]